MRTQALFLIALFSGAFAWSQQSFPLVKGTTLADKAMTVPQSNGKYSVIAIAFHRDAENSLKNWLNPLYESFIKKEEGGPFDMSEWMDVNFVFIPMIQGFRRVADDFKKNTDEQFWPYIMDTEKTDVSHLQQTLGVKDNKEPYFYVVDKNGKVVQSVHGAFRLISSPNLRMRWSERMSRASGYC